MLHVPAFALSLRFLKGNNRHVLKWLDLNRAKHLLCIDVSNGIAKPWPTEPTTGLREFFKLDQAAAIFILLNVADGGIELRVSMDFMVAWVTSIIGVMDDQDLACRPSASLI